MNQGHIVRSVTKPRHKTQEVIYQAPKVVQVGYSYGQICPARRKTILCLLDKVPRGGRGGAGKSEVRKPWWWCSRGRRAGGEGGRWFLRDFGYCVTETEHLWGRKRRIFTPVQSSLRRKAQHACTLQTSARTGWASIRLSPWLTIVPSYRRLEPPALPVHIIPAALALASQLT